MRLIFTATAAWLLMFHSAVWAATPSPFIEDLTWV